MGREKNLGRMARAAAMRKKKRRKSGRGESKWKKGEEREKSGSRVTGGLGGKGQEGRRVPRSICRPRKKGKPGKDGKQLNRG